VHAEDRAAYTKDAAEDADDGSGDWAREHWSDTAIEGEVEVERPSGTVRRDARAVTLNAVHVEGMGELLEPEAEVELRFSHLGLAVHRETGDSALVQMRWREIHAIEVPHARTRLRRRRREGARLVVVSDSGAFTFETPRRTGDEVRSRLAPFGKLR
jgi:hypothetical protein